MAKKQYGRTSGGTRPNRNVVMARITKREGGAVEASLLQAKEIVARYWEELVGLPPDDVFRVVSAELDAARKRLSKAK